MTSYSYDHASRLTGITYPGSGGTDSMSYNAMDTRLSRTENGATVDFRRSGPGVTDPLLSDSGATYTPGVSERRGSTTTYQHSGLKNATTQTGTSQTVTASRKYDAFGQVLGSTGTWQGPFGYAGGFGYQSSDRSGLQLLGHRYYDPSEGRFITKDPAKDGKNWFDYCAGNPLTKNDRSGLKPRNPSKEERAWIDEAIRGIDPCGTGYISDDLNELLRKRRLLIDDELIDDAVTPISGCNLLVPDKIILNGNLLKFLVEEKGHKLRAKFVFE